MKTFAIAAFTAVSAYATQIASVDVEGVMGVSSALDYSVTGEEGARTGTWTQTWSADMQGDYTIGSGTAYVWQCTEDPEIQNEEGATTPANAVCQVIMMSREVKDNVKSAAKVYEWKVNYANYRISDAVAANLGSPRDYFNLMTNGNKAVYIGEASATSFNAGEPM